MQPGQTAISPMIVPCVEEKCPLYNPQEEICSLGAVTGIHNAIAALGAILLELKLILSPPLNSPSPLMRIAESLAAIVDNQTKKG